MDHRSWAPRRPIRASAPALGHLRCPGLIAHVRVEACRWPTGRAIPACFSTLRRLGAAAGNTEALRRSAEQRHDPETSREPHHRACRIFHHHNWGVARPSKKYSPIPAGLNGQHDRHSSGHSRQTEPKVVHTMVSLDWRRRPYRVNYRCEGITPEPSDSPNARQGSRGTSQFPPEECVYTC